MSSADSSSYALIAALSRAVMPDAPVAPGLVLAGTDSRAYTDVAENVYRFQPLMFSAEVPGRVLAGKVDVGLVLHPEPMRGVRSELLRVEPRRIRVQRRERHADETNSFLHRKLSLE